MKEISWFFDLQNPTKTGIIGAENRLYVLFILGISIYCKEYIVRNFLLIRLKS